MREPVILDREKGIVKFGDVIITGPPDRILFELRSRGWEGREILGYSLQPQEKRPEESKSWLRNKEISDYRSKTPVIQTPEHKIVKAQVYCDKYYPDNVSCMGCRERGIKDVTQELIGYSKAYFCGSRDLKVRLSYNFLNKIIGKSH
jgi:hypothetical protein